MSHLSGECRRKIFLKQFGEEMENNDENDCCDVCSNQHSVTLIDRQRELSIAIDAQ